MGVPATIAARTTPGADFVTIRVRGRRCVNDSLAWTTLCSGRAAAKLGGEQHDIHGGEKLVERRLLEPADPARQRRRRHTELARERVETALDLARPMERTRVDRHPRLGKRRDFRPLADRFWHGWRKRRRRGAQSSSGAAFRNFAWANSCSVPIAVASLVPNAGANSIN